MRAARARLSATVSALVGRCGPEQQAERADPFVKSRAGSPAADSGAVDAAAELERHMRPRHLLVEERREAALIDGRRERLGADGVERAVQHPAADAALQAADRAVRPHQLELGGVVVNAVPTSEPSSSSCL